MIWVPTVSSFWEVRIHREFARRGKQWVCLRRLITDTLASGQKRARAPTDAMSRILCPCAVPWSLPPFRHLQFKAPGNFVASW